VSVSAIMPGDSQEGAMKEKETQFPDAICEPRPYQKISGYFGRNIEVSETLKKIEIFRGFWLSSSLAIFFK